MDRQLIQDWHMQRVNIFKVVDSDDWVDLKKLPQSTGNARKKFDEAEEPDMVIANYVYEKVGAKRKKVIHYDNVFPEETLFYME